MLVAASAGAGDVVQEVAASAEIELEDGKAPTRFKLLPMGRIELRDGRGPYTLRDKAHAERVVASIQSYYGSSDMPGDYSHGMLHEMKQVPLASAESAKASGWVKPANITAEADGIYANEVAWTPAAAAAIEAKEYRYISPLFTARKPEKGGEVLGITNFALVGVGAIKNLPALIPAGASGEHEEMDLSALAVLLGLAADASQEMVAAAIKKLQTPDVSVVAAAAGLEAGASLDAIAASITKMKADLDASVPKEIVDDLKAELGTLRSDRLGKEVDALVAAGVVLPRKRDQVLDWFKDNEVKARAFYADMPAVIAAGSVLGDRKVDPDSDHLDADEIAACTMLGLSREDFLASRKEMAQ